MFEKQTKAFLNSKETNKFTDNRVCSSYISFRYIAKTAVKPQILSRKVKISEEELSIITNETILHNEI